MPIQAIDGEYEVELTHECNWHCPYCAIDVHNLPVLTHIDIVAKLNKIPSKSVVTLSGGEPGLISRDELDYVIMHLREKNCKLNLNTNGTFIAKYPSLLSQFEEIVYHCSEDLDPEKINKVNHCNVRYMIIVNDSNVYKLDAFLDMNRHIQFDIVQATYNNKGDGVELSNVNRNMILRKYAKRMTKESARRLLHEKEWDKMVFL